VRLKDKIAIVTGGSQGIGEAICNAYAREGAIVIVVNKNHPEAGLKAAHNINQENGRAEAFTCDVSDENSVNHLINQVSKKL
jgi:NAD(P)-dependent dehydrogenase (short-subunit alcohol dehydrogenase family)